MSSSTTSPSPLECELWVFVESLAEPAASPAQSPETRLEQIQQQARDLLTRRRETNGTDEFPAASAAAVAADNGQVDGEDRKDEDHEGATTSEAKEKMYEAVNERIARRMIDGVEPPNRGAATASTSEDKSDTLSDCTTITETSSVYGIHNTWVDLATLYSLPFVMSDSNHRLKPVPPLNIAQEQRHLNKIFQECQRAVHTMRAVATVDALRKVLDRGVTVLHFSGHGGRIVGQSQYLMFEDTQCSGLAHLVDSTTLRSILSSGTSPSAPEEISIGDSSISLEVAEDNTPPVGDPGFPPRTASQVSSSRSTDGRPTMSCTLKLVFVSSCDSRDIGEVFIQAGVAHVVCVRSEGRILDESSAMFSYSFYHAALTGKTVQQAFESARVRVSAEMRIPDGEGEKFVLLESSQLHAETCPLSFSGETPRAIEVNFVEKSCSCSASTQQFVFSDISVGKWVDVSPSNKFSKTLPAVSESFVGREQELHMLAELVNTRRLVTLRGPPGIGKSTLSTKLAHFLADRNAFPDGVAFIRLRGVQSLEGVESAIKSALFPEGGREKDMPLDQALADTKVLLVMDNMEDPINANPSAIRDFLLQLLQNTPSLSFLMTARQAMGGGINEFDEKNEVLESLCLADRDLFLYNTSRHFQKVSFWVFQHICTLTIQSSAAYLILDLHESNLWMILDLHMCMIEEWQTENTVSSPRPTRTSLDTGSNAESGNSDAINLREKIAGYVMDVACYLAHSLFLSGRHRGAWNAANKALHIAKQHKNTLCQANIRKLMGILLTTETKFDEAKAQFGTALILYKTAGNKIGQAASLSAIGMIHSRNGNLRGAHNCFTKALTLYEWYKHSLGQLNCHQRLANLEKKLRDGDGSALKNGPNSGHSHHYAATRRLQGDLNRKRNGEYIVRWVGHETSLLLELPSPTAEDDAQSRSGALTTPSPGLPFPLGTAAKATAPGITNSPKKGKLSSLIEQKEKNRANSTVNAISTSTASSTSSNPVEGQCDKFKNSSFAKRKEYDSNIRKSAAIPNSASSTSAPEP
ncbi:hypothetical protein PF010_g7707 [Phytophthora fragariae]|uniref:CHAT domain-containing protein n=1 Tax=Phytophthora fragariae TaxID=53985 RepID=A0A6G0LHW9_9STRA|nr:hypothetical protein PF010_g7707 [Phytophthora fragariae]